MGIPDTFYHPDYRERALSFATGDLDPKHIEEGLKDLHPAVQFAAKRAKAISKGQTAVDKFIITHNLNSNGAELHDIMFFHLPDSFTKDPDMLQELKRYSKDCFGALHNHFQDNILGYVSYTKDDATNQAKVSHTGFPLYKLDRHETIQAHDFIKSILGVDCNLDMPAYNPKLLTDIRLYLGTHDVHFYVSKVFEQAVL
jgi:hypothetical protein